MTEYSTAGNKILLLLAAGAMSFAASCNHGQISAGENEMTSLETRLNEMTSLETRLKEMADSVDGRVGIAVITSWGDTLTVNNDWHYPLMSVFKLHQALTVASELDRRGVGFDTILHISREEMNPSTWSPMACNYSGVDFDMSVDSLLIYTLQQSDNNASNILFDRIADVGMTDSFIRSVIPADSFRVVCSEAQMQVDHNLSRENWSSPLACAVLADRLFKDSLVSVEKQDFICRLMAECATGKDRLAAGLPADNSVSLSHKTGSGFRDSSGRLMAHNDVGLVRFDDGRRYAVAVLVTDFNGSEQEASGVIARISRMIYDKVSVSSTVE